MTKTELVSKITEVSKVTKGNIEAVLAALPEVMEEVLKAGDDIRIPGVGVFETRDRAERKGRNPKTGEEIIIAATKTVGFKAAKSLKNSVKE